MDNDKKFILSEEFHVYSSPVNSEPYQLLHQKVGGANGKIFSGIWFCGFLAIWINLAIPPPFDAWFWLKI